MWRMEEFNYPPPPQHKTILYISDNTSKRYLQMTMILWNTTKMTIGLELLLSSIVHEIPSERKPNRTKTCVPLDRKRLSFWRDFVLTGRPRTPAPELTCNPDLTVNSNPKCNPSPQLTIKLCLQHSNWTDLNSSSKHVYLIPTWLFTSAFAN